METPRLILRELELEDQELMFEMDRDPEVHRFLGNNPITSIERIREIILFVKKQYADYGIGRWAVVEKESGNFIGWSGLKWITEETNGRSHFYDLGYRFLRSAWGKGYATESARVVMQYGFDVLKVDALFATADPGNKASLNVLDKLGFIQEGLFQYDGEEQVWLRKGREVHDSTNRS